MTTLPRKPAPPPRQAERVTAASVAERLGISRPSVNIAFGAKSRSSRISPELRQRILATAEEMGYRPNAAARAVRCGRFHAIGLVQATDGGAGMISQGTLWGIEERLLDLKLQLVLGQMPTGKLGEPQALPQLLREWLVDGLILHYCYTLDDDLLAHVKSMGVPHVWINRNEAHGCVHQDDFGAAQRAAERLIEAGHRRISFLGADMPMHYSSADRVKGYRRAMEAAGLAADVHVTPEESLHEVATSVLRQPDRPTGIVCGIGPVNVILAASLLGLRLPRDLSLIALRHAISKVGPYDVATMVEPTYRVGHAAVQMVTELIKQPGTLPESRTVTFESHEGETIGPPVKP